ncbi:type IV pilin [Halorubellus salinus]|uniref:type IV pilin n=1 Tax=Halorubellus salinus TaxID=755309 RepID=UPI001D0705B2|nr:type IV pilin [Halorubellus salinus]
MRKGSDRGASSPMGSLLMVALTLVVVGATGVFVFDLAPSDEERAPAASVSVTAVVDGENAQQLVVAHDGGDALAIAEFDVVVRDAGTTTRTPLSAFDDRSGTSGGVVDAGDTLRTAFLLDGPTTVQLVHRPSGSVVVEQSVSRPDSSPDVVDMDASDPTQSFESSQDGDGETTVEAGGATVRMEGNQWKYVDYDYDVTADTMLFFEFNSTARGEIHGIGLEDDQDQTGARIVQVFGVQDWGKNVSDFAGAEYYELSDGWIRYEIPVGEHYESSGLPSEIEHLVFVNDCDGNVDNSRASCPSEDGSRTLANSQFRNVRVYEPSASPVVVASRQGPGVGAVNATASGRWTS